MDIRDESLSIRIAVFGSIISSILVNRIFLIWRGRSHFSGRGRSAEQEKS